MFTIVLAGFLLGLAGSLHCVGMCGPLSLGLPIHHLPAMRKAAALGVYHAGRICTYALIGLLFGLAGRRFYLAGMQQTLSIVLGSIILLFTIQYFILRHTWQPSFVKKFHARIQHLMIRLLDNGSPANYWLFGSLNALLPCGMVYIAIASAMSFDNVIKSMIFMGSFGFATLPAMFTLGFFGYLLDTGVRNRMRKLSPYIICGIGALLILRGLNLGIPFISPIMESAPGASASCH